MKSIGDRIKYKRTQSLRVSQVQLGKMVGVSGTSVTYWERNETEPTSKVLPLLAKSLGVTINWLLVGNEDNSNNVENPIYLKKALNNIWGIILDDREMTAWAQNIGLEGSLVSKLFDDGLLPSSKHLTKIMRSENVSLNALLGSSNAPFVVHRTINNADTFQQIKPYIEDEKWDIHIISGAEYPIIVLSTLAEDGDGFKYTPIEVICGPADIATANLFKGLKVMHKALPKDEANELATGYKGTYYLFGKTTLLDAKEINHSEIMTLFRRKANTNAKTLKKIMQIIDDTMVEEDANLSAEERRRLVAELYTYAVNEGFGAGDISENLVTSMMRVI